jgi:hypothetical protein
VFTTVLALPRNPTPDRVRSHEDYDVAAGRKLRDFARSQGLTAVEDQLWVGVSGMKGPLVETGVDTAKRFTHDVLAPLRG